MVYNINGIRIDSAVAINVKDYGAKGDGTTNDAPFIQLSLDAVQNGGVVFFPNGTYNLSASVRFYSNQILLFADAVIRSTTSSVTNLFRTYCDSTITEYNGVHDTVICGATFDGSGHGLNNTLFAIAHAKNILITDCSFFDGKVGYHNIEINSSENVRITNCEFTRGSTSSSSGEMIQLDIDAGSAVYPWDNVVGDNTQCRFITIDNCWFHNNTASPAIGRHNGTPQYVDIYGNRFDGLTGERGAIDCSGTYIHIHDNTFTGCTLGIDDNGATHIIHDNIFVDATTAITTGSGIIYNNIINGTLVATGV